MSLVLILQEIRLPMILGDWDECDGFGEVDLPLEICFACVSRATVDPSTGYFSHPTSPDFSNHPQEVLYDPPFHPSA
eukprot:757847-Hanusia_phi.AAC.5